jgi:hypothetical protein
MVRKGCACDLANVEIDIFDRPADEHGGAGAERAPLSSHKGGAAAQGLFGCVVRFLRIDVRKLEERVVGGDDVLDGGAVTGFAQGNGVDGIGRVASLRPAKALVARTHFLTTGTVSRTLPEGSGESTELFGMCRR